MPIHTFTSMLLKVEEKIEAGVKKQLQESLKSIARPLNMIDKELGPIKSFSKETYTIILEVRFKKGIDDVESAYQVFLEGAGMQFNQ